MFPGWALKVESDPQNSNSLSYFGITSLISPLIGIYYHTLSHSIAIYSKVQNHNYLKGMFTSMRTIKLYFNAIAPLLHAFQSRY